jgi:hypothetical protein
MFLGKRSFATLGLVLLIACTSSKVDQNATVTLRGRVLDAAGAPAVGAKVSLFKEADAGEVLVGATLELASLGLACFTPQAPAVCAKSPQTSTGADGAFVFTLRGRDTQGSVGNADAFDVTAAVGDAVSALRFKIQRTTLELPALRTWGAPVTLEDAGASVRAAWPALGPAYGVDPSYSVRFTVGPQWVWNVPNARTGQLVDKRLLEDASGNAVVAATAGSAEKGPDTTYRFTYFTGTAPFRGAGAPPSRRARCVVYDTGDKPAPVSPCPLTDGDLFKAAGISGGVHTAAGVDRGSSQPASLVVVRGGAGVMIVEASNDGQAWTSLGTGTGSLLSVTAPPGTRARFVRARSTASTDVSNLAEISVWT